MAKKTPPKVSGQLTQGQVDLWRTLESLAGIESLTDWVTLMSPTYEAPTHLGKLLEVIVRSQFEPTYAWCSVPPRFAKTETILHAIAWRLLQDPTCEIAYCTYEANLAYSKSRKIRELAEAAGVQLKKGSTGVHEWQTAQGGRVKATGIGGPLTGTGCKWLVIDDAIKNREEAESPVIRQKHWDWLTSTALTRVEPGGSVLINATRWHDDDLIGRVQAAFPEWTGVHMPAVIETTDPLTQIVKRRSLWPSRWPLAELDKKKRLVGEFDWASLYQGQPRPKGGRLFSSVQRYTDPMITENDRPYKIIIGADPAATEHTYSDYSVACVMAFSGRFGTLDFRADILEVWKGQVQVPAFVARLRDLAVKWGAPIAVEAVAGFKAVPQMLRNLDPKLKIFEAAALGDKFTRALPVAAAWNDGRVRVPQSADWLSDFLTEVEKFTGIKDAHDDQVDAMAHAYNSAQMIIPQILNLPIVPLKSGLPFG